MQPLFPKRIFLVFALLCLFFHGFSQLEYGDEKQGKFKRENIFIGSGLNLGLGNLSFNVGINPEIGYSLTRWLDAGVSLNLNYFSQNASEFSSIRLRNFNYGGGPLVRIWPMSFLYIQLQPEYNWISSSQKDVISNYTGTLHTDAGSLLVGVGYGTKLIGSHYSYLSLMIDVLQNRNSPYRDQYNDPLPIFRAGFGFYLKARH
jgi:hypothetical protein